MTDSAPQITVDEVYGLKAAVVGTFTPGRPVKHLDLLAGRHEQINKVLEAVLSPGQHAAIYGERGVGKSSLANLIYDMVFAAGAQDFIPVHVNCGVKVTFQTMWAEVFRQLDARAKPEVHLLSQFPEQDPGPEDIRSVFGQLKARSIIVLDEYDRVDDNVAVEMADTIKTLSDRDIPTTLVFVGVAEDVEQLIREHSSIDRALIQVPMPRMSREELIDIVTRGMARLPRLQLENGLAQRMADISKGLPHFTHLLAKHSLMAAIEDRKLLVSPKYYERALKTSTEEKSQSLGQAYREATYSARETIFEEVLLACALATDEQGMFGAKDVRAPLSRVLKKPMKIEAYIRHLDKFTQSERGPALKKEGQQRRFQYSFMEPMMQPYVLMKGLAENKITEHDLGVLSDAPRTDYLFSPRG